MKKRIFIGGFICVIVLTMLAGCTGKGNTNKQKQDKPAVTYKNLMDSQQENVQNEALTCWYTEAADEKWLANMAKAFQKEYGKKVDLVFYDGNSFYEIDLKCLEEKKTFCKM